MTKEKLGGLDLLRGLCAISVMAYHYIMWSTGIIFYPFGTYAVYLFFTLSGFTLFYVYADQPMNENTLKRFWVARFFRIFPLFALVCLLYSGNVGMLALNLSFLFGLTNPGATAVAIGGWSIGIEFIFYFLFPFFWLFRDKKSLRNLFILSLIISFFYIRKVFKTGCNLADCWTEYTQVVTFLPFFIGGCLMMLYRQHLFSVQQRLWITIASVILLMVTLLLPQTIYAETHLFLKSPLMSLWIILAMIIVYGFSYFPEQYIPKKLAELFGNLSYSLYLIHPFVWFHFSKTGLTFEASPKQYILAAVATTIILSLLLFYCVEKPCRNLGRRLAASLPSPVESNKLR